MAACLKSNAMPGAACASGVPRHSGRDQPRDACEDQIELRQGWSRGTDRRQSRRPCWSHRRLPGSGMSVLRRALSAACLCVGLSSAAHAEVEWFTVEKPGEGGYAFTSTMYVEARASVAASSDSTCAAAIGNPRPRQLQRHQQAQASGAPVCDGDVVALTPGSSVQFERTMSAVASSDDKDAPHTTVTATVTQRARFDTSGMNLELRTESRIARSPTETRVRSARVQPSAFGHVYFRVPAGRPLRLNFFATLTWEGQAHANGDFGIHPMPNTGAKGGIAFQPAHVKLSEESVARKVAGKWFPPGVYRLEWRAGTDGRANATVNLDVKIVFHRRCPDPTGDLPGWPEGRDAGLTVEERPRSGKPKVRWSVKCEMEGSPTCWQEERVLFDLVRKDGKRIEQLEGWRYRPGTLTVDPAGGLACSELDPRYNCHGYTFAAGEYWIDDASAQTILDQWCQQIGDGDGQLSGDIRVFKDYDIWPFFELAHSQTRRVGDAFDDKRGECRLGSEHDQCKLWIDTPVDYRCEF